MSTKTATRFFTIADYEEEEIWLREQHRNGWKLTKTTLPCFYTFESCVPEDVIYRLDFQNGGEKDDYYQIFRDYGWEPFERMAGWIYFRKRAAEVDAEQDGELFSDSSSRIERVDRIFRTRMLPLLIIFCGCLIPNFIMSVLGGYPFADVFTGVFGALVLAYVYLLVYCGLRLRALRKKYGDRD